MSSTYLENKCWVARAGHTHPPDGEIENGKCKIENHFQFSIFNFHSPVGRKCGFLSS
jgi:hypothetical protein